MTICSKNLGEHGPVDPPRLRLCLWHYRSFSNTSVSGSNSETIVHCFACHSISVFTVDLTCFIVENVHIVDLTFRITTKENLHSFIRPGLLYWFPGQNSQLVHQTGTSILVLLTGKTIWLPTLFFALHKQHCASGSFKQQFPLNLHSVCVVHFALIAANWRISSISRGFGLLGFCLPRIWTHVLRRSLELSGSIASLLQVSSTCADAATAMFDCSPSTK